MKQFEAKTLEEVYELATNEFKCSITELEIDIIQQPSKGFLGFGKKSAIIGAEFKRKRNNYRNNNRNHKLRKSNLKIEDVSKKIEDSNRDTHPKKQHKPTKKINVPKIEKEEIFDNFYTEANEKTEHTTVVVKKNKKNILDEVSLKINNLFETTCYELNEVKVSYYDDETLYIEFNGNDSALLIGKEGYRYKALSYILFNWINEKYNLMVRLEVAEFLKNQEEAIHNYLEPVIVTIHEKGSFKTKPLDGILVHIALKKLREEFPEKYVAVKTNVRGDKYVLVNEYRQKQN